MPDTSQTTAVERLYPDDFARVYPLLERHGPAISKDQWRTLFDYGFQRDEEHVGYGLVDGDAVVGYVGLIFSQRDISDNIERFCNATSWIVDVAYRQSSLDLMLPVIRLKSHVLTDFSPAPDVARWCVRWGFKELEKHARVLWSTGLPTPRRAQAAITTRPEEMGKHLADEELQILTDHRPFSGCKHLLIKADGRLCYLLYTRVPRTLGLSYAHVLYASDPEVFARHSVQIRRALARETRTRFVAIDERHVRGLKLPRAHTVTMSVPRFYRSNDVKPEHIDSLYSEMAMLGLSSYSVPFPSPRRQSLLSKSDTGEKS
jgi:hypothetical protein